MLYLNDGIGTCTHAPSARWPATAESTYCVALGDIDGRGIAHARVVAVPAEWAAESLGHDVMMPGRRDGDGYPTLHAETDADGRYEIAGVGRGDHYAFHAIAEGFANGTIEDRRDPASGDVALRIEACGCRPTEWSGHLADGESLDLGKGGRQVEVGR